MAAIKRNPSDAVPNEEVYGKVIDIADSGLTVPTISYGLPFDQAVLKHITAEARIYVIASKTLSEKTDNLTRLQSALGKRIVGIRIGMTPHTLYDECLSVAAAARSVSANTVLTLGAGSLADAAKFVCEALTNHFTTLDDLERAADAADPQRHCGEDYATVLERDRRVQPTGRLILIPTSLSGGEHNPYAGITDGNTKRKYQIRVKGSDVTILDPWLCMSTPANIWLQSGVRGIDHCVEGILSIKQVPEAIEAARKGLELLVPGLLDCKHDVEGTDVKARLNAQIGVALAMLSVVVWQLPAGASHAIGHMLGPMGVGHGETSCILLPAVCKYNAEVKEHEQRQRHVRDILWGIPACKKIFEREDLKEDKADLGDLLDKIIRELGMPRTLKEKGVEGQRVRDLAEMSLHDFWMETNPRPLYEADEVMKILEMVRQ